MTFNQSKIMRDTFYAAWGQLLLLMEDDFTELPDREGADALDSMNEQVVRHFSKNIPKGN